MKSVLILLCIGMSLPTQAAWPWHRSVPSVIDPDGLLTPVEKKLLKTVANTAPKVGKKKMKVVIVFARRLPPNAGMENPKYPAGGAAAEASKKYKVGDGSKNASLLMYIAREPGNNPYRKWAISIGGPAEEYFLGSSTVTTSSFVAFFETVTADLKLQANLPPAKRHIALALGAKNSLETIFKGMKEQEKH